MGKRSGESPKKNKTCQKQATFENCFSEGPAGIQGFFHIYAYLCYFLELWQIELSFQNNFDQSQDKQSTILRKNLHDK